MSRYAAAALVGTWLLAGVAQAQQEFQLAEPPLLADFVAEQQSRPTQNVVPASFQSAAADGEFAPADAPPHQPVDVSEERLTAIEQGLKDLKAVGGKLPRVTPSGVFQADTVMFSQDAENRATYGDIQNGTGFRRTRLGLAAQVTDNTQAFIQMDFGFPGRPTFTDVWGEINLLPVVGNVRIGQWKQPFSLEVVSAFRFTTFMERSVLFQAFAPFRRLGVGFYDHSDDLQATWAASVFASGQDQYGDTLADNNGVGFCERVTYLPYYDEAADGRYYLHLGAAHFFNAPPGNSVLFRSGPEIFAGQFGGGTGAAVGTTGQAVGTTLNGTPFFVSANVPVYAYNVLGQELLYVNGPFSFQAEAMTAIVNPIGPCGTCLLPGFYAQAGYFLTGEHRPYIREAGAIDRVIPFENFFRIRTGERICSGWGAIEIANRVSFIDLNDGPINGGQMVDYTAGVNWFWNPNIKVVANYVHNWVNPGNLTGQGPGGVALPPPATNSGPLSNMSTVAFRLQVDF